MINDLNRVTLMGHIGSDPKSLSSDNAPLRLSVATASHWMVENTRTSRTDWHRSHLRESSEVRRKAEEGRPRLHRGRGPHNNYDKTMGGETITLYTTEFVASQIELVNAKVNAEAQD